MSDRTLAAKPSQLNVVDGEAGGRHGFMAVKKDWSLWSRDLNELGVPIGSNGIVPFEPVHPKNSVVGAQCEDFMLVENSWPCVHQVHDGMTAEQVRSPSSVTLARQARGKGWTLSRQFASC